MEDVQSIAGFAANGKERIARWFACRALRAYYPYVGGKRYWNEVQNDLEWHARHVLELIQFEFRFTADHRDAKEFERERNIAERFASRLRVGRDRQLCAETLNRSRSEYLTGAVPSGKGVYARFREADDPVPMYIGMGDMQSAMSKRHSRYSGKHKIYVKCFRDDDCKTTEKKLLTVFDPPENDHHWNRYEWIKHADELPEWFVSEIA